MSGGQHPTVEQACWDSAVRLWAVGLTAAAAVALYALLRPAAPLPQPHTPAAP